MPLWVLGWGYAIGSRTGLCFWLAWKGTRESMWYEHEERKYLQDQNDSQNEYGYGNGLRATSSPIGASHIPMPSPTYSSFDHGSKGSPFAKIGKLFRRDTNLDAYHGSQSLAEKGLLNQGYPYGYTRTGIRTTPPSPPPPPRSFIQVLSSWFSRRSSKNVAQPTMLRPYPSEHASDRRSIASDPSFDCFPSFSPISRSPFLHQSTSHTSTSGSGSTSTKLKSMIGAATTVGKVEDERIKRIQLRSAMKVAVLLLLASVASGVAVWLVPCPRVFEGAVMH